MRWLAKLNDIKRDSHVLLQQRLEAGGECTLTKSALGKVVGPKSVGVGANVPKASLVCSWQCPAQSHHSIRKERERLRPSQRPLPYLQGWPPPVMQSYIICKSRPQSTGSVSAMIVSTGSFPSASNSGRLAAALPYDWNGVMAGMAEPISSQVTCSRHPRLLVSSTPAVPPNSSPSHHGREAHRPPDGL